MGGDPEYVDLHELAKGWKAALAWAMDPATRNEARTKNDRGNLPLHSAASFRAPCEVIGESVELVTFVSFCFGHYLFWGLFYLSCFDRVF